MRKKIKIMKTLWLAIAILGMGISTVYSQVDGNVGVNILESSTPNVTLDVIGAATNVNNMDGIIAPRITGEQLRAKTYTVAQDGAIVYVTLADPNPAGQTIKVKAKGYYYFDILKNGGLGEWVRLACCKGTGPDGIITNIDCDAAIHIGTLNEGEFVYVKSKISYTGGNGLEHFGQTVASTGVTGLIATLSSGTFANGAGSLTYIITGVPAAAGTASFAINIGGQTCTLNIPVTAPIGVITSLDCAGANHIGTLQCKKSASGVSSVIGYTGGNGGTYTGQSVSSTGVTGLTATLAAGSFANGAGSLTYTISGTPTTTGTASFAINVGGQACTFSRAVTTPEVIIAECPQAYTPITEGNTAKITLTDASYTNVSWSSSNTSAATVAVSASGEVIVTAVTTGMSATAPPIVVDIIAKAVDGCAEDTYKVHVLPKITRPDGDGIIYGAKSYGCQVWTLSNMYTTHYNDGTAIPNVTGNSDWGSSTTPAYCWYNNDDTDKATYGALYNSYAASTDKICPTGWHVPTEADWLVFYNYLCLSCVQNAGSGTSYPDIGGLLKEAGTTHWQSPNMGATNEYGFTALPAGFRQYDGVFKQQKQTSFFWSTTLHTHSSGEKRAYAPFVRYGSSAIQWINSKRSAGASIRCIRND